MFWASLSFPFYLPIFLGAIALGIVAIAQRRRGHGIAILLMALFIPLVIGHGLGAFQVQQVMKAARKSEEGIAGVRVKAPLTDVAGTLREQQYIADNLELFDFQAKYMSDVVDGRIPGVTFKIKNKGERVLERINVVVYFRDASGEVIAEEDYTPVLVSRFNRAEDNRPLMPGQIWQQEWGSFYTAKSVPVEWKEGAAEARIVEIRVEKKGP